MNTRKRVAHSALLYTYISPGRAAIISFYRWLLLGPRDELASITQIITGGAVRSVMRQSRAVNHMPFVCDCVCVFAAEVGRLLRRMRSEASAREVQFASANDVAAAAAATAVVCKFSVGLCLFLPMRFRESSQCVFFTLPE